MIINLLKTELIKVVLPFILGADKEIVKDELLQIEK